MKKKNIKLWEKILIIVLVIVSIFIILTVRKMVIIGNLQHKNSQYINSNNYHATISSYYGRNLQISDTYKKGNKILSTLKSFNTNNTKTITNYSDGIVSHTYLDVAETKIAILNGEGNVGSIQITNELSTQNIGQFLIMSVFSSINSEECNGKQCYKIEVAYSLTNKTTIYFDKNTGLKVREFNGTIGEGNEKVNIVSDYKFEFDTVKDEDLKEPNLEQYTIQ